VNAWKPQVKGNVDAAAADNKVAAYPGPCVQVCNDASLFITSSLSTIIIIIIIIIVVVVVVVVVIEERGSPCSVERTRCPQVAGDGGRGG